MGSFYKENLVVSVKPTDTSHPQIVGFQGTTSHLVTCAQVESKAGVSAKGIVGISYGSLYGCVSG